MLSCCIPIIVIIIIVIIMTATVLYIILDSCNWRFANILKIKRYNLYERRVEKSWLKLMVGG